MARTLDPAAHSLRRDAFMDAAQRLIQAKGYEQMSIQDVLDDLGTSRGAFYHYFDSKVALLEGVVERIVDAATGALEPIAEEPGLPAVQKLQRVFTGLAVWKTERLDFLVALMQVWFSDENAIMREKLRQRTMLRFTPMLAGIVRQGIEEGTCTARSAEHTARVFVSLLLGANETIGRLWVARQANAVPFEEVEQTIAAFTEAFERVLGLPAGSWPTFDAATLHQWFG